MEYACMSAFFLGQLKECLTLFIRLYHLSQTLIHQHGIKFALLTAQ